MRRAPWLATKLCDGCVLGAERYAAKSCSQSLVGGARIGVGRDRVSRMKSRGRLGQVHWRLTDYMAAMSSPKRRVWMPLRVRKRVRRLSSPRWTGVSVACGLKNGMRTRALRACRSKVDARRKLTWGGAAGGKWAYDDTRVWLCERRPQNDKNNSGSVDSPTGKRARRETGLCIRETMQGGKASKGGSLSCLFSF